MIGVSSRSRPQWTSFPSVEKGYPPDPPSRPGSEEWRCGLTKPVLLHLDHPQNHWRELHGTAEARVLHPQLAARSSEGTQCAAELGSLGLNSCASRA